MNWDNSKSVGAAVGLVLLSSKNKYLKKNISIGFYVSKLAGALLEKTPAGELGPRSRSPSLPDLGRNRTGRTRIRDGEDGPEKHDSKAAAI